MRAGEWAALLTAVAGVLAALAAIPAGAYRTVVLLGAAPLVLVAFAVAALSLRHPQPAFTIQEPCPDQRIVPGAGAVVVRGTAPDLHSDTLWVFEEGLVGGQRV